MAGSSKVTDLQQALNHFTSTYLLHVTPLHVDGVKGHATNSRVMACKYYLGYGRDRDGEAKALFRRRLAHPHTRLYFTKAMYHAGWERREHQRAQETAHHFTATHTKGVVLFDGKPCALWLATICQKVRDAGRWKGQLTSGWRDPVYSESLCERMCGAPRCPGKCAGRSSNHSGIAKPAGAVDVTDYATFGKECARLKVGIHNSLGAQDPVHFSTAGN